MLSRWRVWTKRIQFSRVNRGEWGGFSDSLGFEPKYVEPFGHLECLLAVHKGIAYLDNYEANTDHFPLRYKEAYKEKEHLADFAIIWRTEYGDVGGLEEEYDLIDSNDYNRLYRRKTHATPIHRCGRAEPLSPLTCSLKRGRQHSDIFLYMWIRLTLMENMAG